MKSTIQNYGAAMTAQEQVFAVNDSVVSRINEL